MTTLLSLAADIGRAEALAPTIMAKVIEVGANKIKRQMRVDFTGHRYAPLIPDAIGYDIEGLTATIGVDKDGPQGGLGNILAYGTSNNAPVVDITASLLAEAPHAQTALSAAVSRLL